MPTKGYTFRQLTVANFVDFCEVFDLAGRSTIQTSLYAFEIAEKAYQFDEIMLINYAHKTVHLRRLRWSTGLAVAADFTRFRHRLDNAQTARQLP